MPIEFRELSYVYSKDMPYAYKALKEINLEIEEGKINAIIGETGSGKSTLVQHLNALLLPSEGELEIAGYTIRANEKTKGLKYLRKKVGLVFQFSEYQLFEETILKDVSFGPKNFGVSEEEAIIKAKEALKLVGIDESMYEKSPLDLSGGQKRRVAIAGILAMEPEIIVLDEPTAGLDPKGSKEMIGLFSKLNKEMHKTIILVTHDNEVVYNYADNVILLSHGEIVLNKDAREFFDDKELLDRLHILKPQIVELKELLNAKGYKIGNEVRDIKALAKAIKEIKKHE
ncbi:MAG: energy-coupling factor transporter ATPase [Firmicutes bacterium]|nr:energy-coupling factor transporter ATPase [Bacillota bacterium]